MFVAFHFECWMASNQKSLQSMNMIHHGISLIMSSIVALAHLWCPGSISHTYWNTRNHRPYEHFYVYSVEICKLRRNLFLTSSHCFHSIEGVTKLTKPNIWFMYILLCKITLIYSVLLISKSPQTYMSCSWSILSFFNSKNPSYLVCSC
jgi:hypothetical protein